MSPAGHRQSASRGFSLIELMIAVAILGIIMSIALPSFMDSIRKGRRAEGIGAIARVQQAQERWRAGNAAYSDNLSAAPTATPPGLGIDANTANGHYALAFEPGSVTPTNYVIVATATGSQAADSNCLKMAARQLGGQISYGSGTSTIDWADPNRCWAK